MQRIGREGVQRRESKKVMKEGLKEEKKRRRKEREREKGGKKEGSEGVKAKGNGARRLRRKKRE